MSHKIYVGEAELASLLLNENTADEALEKYFIFDDSNAFLFKYVLKENVVLVKDPIITKSFLGESALSIANWVARRKRLKIYKESIQNYPSRTRIVSEGDSWFQHPTVKETIDHLLGRFSIMSLGAAGDDMARYTQKAEFFDAIENENPEFFLFSGGGNDLMGGHFDDYLNDYTPDTDGQGFGRFLNQRFHEKIDQLISMYDSIFLEIKTNFPSVKVLVHGYDYVIPREGKKGKWLGKFMEEAGITSQEDKNGGMRYVIDSFNEKLSEVSGQYDHVSYIDLRGVVKPYQWHDEIHPDNLGFQQVAIKFNNEINRLKQP